MALTGTNAAIKSWDATTGASISGPMSLRAIVFTANAAATATLYDASSSAPLFTFATAGADTVPIVFGNDYGMHLPDGIKLSSIGGTGAVVTLYDV